MEHENTDNLGRWSNGLYDPSFDHDACGIGAIAHLHGIRSHQTVDDALSILVNLEHRGGKGLESNTGDGAGILFQLPHRFFRKVSQRYGQILPDEGDYETVAGFLLDRLGRVAEVGDAVDVDGARIEVIKVDGNRIDRVRATPAPQD